MPNSLSGVRLLSLLLLPFLCTCGRAPGQEAVITLVVGSVRYQEDAQQLDADLSIEPQNSHAPTLYGSAMPPFTAVGAGHYRARRKISFPGKVSFALPCGTAERLCPREFSFSPPFPDSIPPTVSHGETVSFPALVAGLLEPEILVIFFEPEDRSSPRRISLQGPTRNGRVTLPKKALQDIPFGNYRVYLIKQRLYADSTARLQTSIQAEYFTKSVAVEVRK